MGMGMHGQMGPGMQGQMGPGMRGQMGPGMRGQMGPGMMGMGMMGGNATMDERRDLHDLFSNHEKIKRTVTNLPDGIRTVTESDDPQVAVTIKKHVAEMGKRVEEGRDPGLPIESPALHAIFRDKDKIKSTYEVTEKGIVVVQTSTDATAVKALQDHAAEVTDLAKRGMVAAHEAIPGSRLEIFDGVFNLMRVDVATVESKRFDYRFSLGARDGSEYYFEGRKVVRSDAELDLKLKGHYLFINI